jgi:hypothetical protein
MITPSATIRVIFHHTELDPGLQDYVSPPIPLKPGFMQRINYSVEVPDSFKGKVATIEFKVADFSTTNNLVEFFNTDPKKGPVGIIAGVGIVTDLVSQIFFLDDVRFSKGLEVKLNGPVVEGGKAKAIVTFAPQDPSKPVQVTVNWNDGANSIDTAILPAGTSSYTSFHTYKDDSPVGTQFDVYPVEVSATNVLGNTNATAQQTVNNVAPVVGPLTVDLPSGGLFEGGEVTVSGTFTDPGLANDSYRIDIVWGDGSGVTTVQAADIVLPTAAVPIGRFTATHRYKDDSPTGTPKDLNSITVIIADDDLGQGTASKTIEIANKPPRIDTLAFVEQNITEGGTAVLKGTFTDEGLLDTHKVRVTWNGGQADLPVTNFANGVGSFEGKITIDDDNPTKTDGDDMTFTVTLTDDDTGAATGTATLHVENAKPEVKMKLDKTAIDEGETAEVTVEFTDKGKKDSFKLKLVWSDGYKQTATAAAGATSHVFTREFLDDNPTDTASDTFKLIVTVTDDDGGEGSSDTVDLTVNNVAPKDVSIAGTGWGDAGITAFALSGSWSDPGTGKYELHKFAWSVTNAQGVEVFASNKETPDPFTLLDAGEYTVTFTVTDDDTGAGTATMSINVSELPLVKWEVTDPKPTDKPPPKGELPINTFKEGDPVSLFFQGDPTGAQGIYTVSVDWGDGTTSNDVPVLPGSGRTVSHIYLDDKSGALLDYYDAKVTFGYSFNSSPGQTGALRAGAVARSPSAAS